MTVHHFDVAALSPMPWKNGAGTTREVLRWPDEGEYDWCASVATIGASGPLTPQPGVDHTLVLIEGEGARLRSKEDGIDHRLDQPLEPFTFPGEAALYAKLIGGPLADFNLLVRRGRLYGAVEILSSETHIEPARHGLLLSLAGTWRLRVGAGEVHCPVQQGLWWADARQRVHAVPETPHAEVGSLLLAVRLDPPNRR